MAEASRKQIFRWMGWFALANALVLALVGARYFQGFQPGGTTLSWIYLILVYPAHHVLLAVLPLFLLLTPIVLIRPYRPLIVALAVLLFAVMIALINLDSLLWQQSRFHLNGLTIRILGASSYIFVAVILVIALIFESLLAARVWKWVSAGRSHNGWLISVLATMAILGSQFIHAWADAAYYVPVTSVGQQLPVYQGITAKSQLMRLGLVDPDTMRQREVARRLSRQLVDSDKGTLNYPLQPLQCSSDHPLNLLIILVDALRWDIVNESAMPFLNLYGETQGQRFLQHFSGGNSSRMGVFSLFYGLPPGYWSSFESSQISAVLMDELQAQDYQLGIFSSASLSRPVALDRTAFANIADLHTQIGLADTPAWQRDQAMLKDWSAWLSRRDTARPFFGFLFFDAPNVRSYPPELELESGIQPDDNLQESPEFTSYKRSARFADQLLQTVIGQLEVAGLARNTVVVVTSDHGEEFDESGGGLVGHGSGYSRYQLQVPLIIHWPGRSPHSFEHRSSHYDIVPTLMQELLACRNPAADYSIGRNLFAGESWRWLLAGSYYNYAMLEPDQITVTYPSGRYEVRDWNYRIRANPEVRTEVLKLVTEENSRFYR